MRTAYFIIVLFIAGLLFLGSTICDNPADPVPCTPSPCDPVPCEVVRLEGIWIITVKHTTSPGDHYELRQMTDGKFETIWEHTFTEAGQGNFVDFRLRGFKHPISNPIGVLVKNSRAEMFVWFEALDK